MIAASDDPIFTERLVLRPIAVAHAPAMFRVLADPALYAWIARAPPACVADVEARFTRIAQRTAPGRAEQWLNWTVWTRAEDEAIGLVEATVTPTNLVRIAYMFGSRVWGLGYASEATSAALMAMEADGATAFEATIDARNAASIALAARLGFAFVESRASEDEIGGGPSVEELWRREC